VIPIINENDTVAIDEIRFGDNDTLAALVTNLIEADALIILTDQAGLYRKDPRKDPTAEFISEARADDPALEAMAGGVGNPYARGGMLTKVLAARRASRSGAHTVIASGQEDRVLPRLAYGETIGTRLVADRPTLAARKQWLADHLQVRERSRSTPELSRRSGHRARACFQSACARRARIRARRGGELRRRVAARDSAGPRELQRRGNPPYLARASGEIEARLGYVDEPELIHRTIWFCFDRNDAHHSCIRNLRNFHCPNPSTDWRHDAPHARSSLLAMVLLSAGVHAATRT